MHAAEPKPSESASVRRSTRFSLLGRNSIGCYVQRPSIESPRADSRCILGQVLSVEATATNPNTMRMLVGSNMLSLSSSWALDALARIGLCPLPITLPEMRPQIAWMTRYLGHRSPLLERMEQLLMQEFGRNRGGGVA